MRSGVYWSALAVGSAAQLAANTGKRLSCVMSIFDVSCLYLHCCNVSGTLSLLLYTLHNAWVIPYIVFHFSHKIARRTCAILRIVLRIPLLVGHHFKDGGVAGDDHCWSGHGRLKLHHKSSRKYQLPAASHCDCGFISRDAKLPLKRRLFMLHPVASAFCYTALSPGQPQKNNR